VVLPGYSSKRYEVVRVLLSPFLRVGDRVFETYRPTDRGVETMVTSYTLLNLIVYGRQEAWEDSSEGWPQLYGVPGCVSSISRCAPSHCDPSHCDFLSTTPVVTSTVLVSSTT
jgi:Bacterial protein of unknown function (DUF899)